MTTAVLRSSPNLAIPQTQNTAPVYEFNCLYTHDLRRKQKRWQDGFLRYHTFNKRVMVYDVPRNFLGDIHWTNGDDLQEGDEMTLDKGAIMVQVAERVGRTETDVSGLLQRKDRTPAKQPTPSSVLSLKQRTPLSVASSLASKPTFSAAPAQGKHKSLTALLGNSRRPIGKASIPTESPFDLRQKAQENAEWSSGRDRKRQKTGNHGMEAVRTPTAKAAQKAATISSKRSTSLSTKNSKSALDVIDISSDTEDTHKSDNIEAELLSASSPNRLDDLPALQPEKQPLLRHKQAVHTMESPSVRLQQRTRASPPPAPTLSPQARRASTSMDVESTDTSDPVGESRRLQKGVSYPSDPDLSKRGKSLKLVGGAPRKMLVFQSQKSRGSSSAAEPERENLQETSKGSDCLPAREASKSEREPTETKYRRRMQERLAQLAKKQRLAGSGSTSDLVEQISDAETNVETAPKKSLPEAAARPKASVNNRGPPVAAVFPPDDSRVDLDTPVTDAMAVQQEELPPPPPKALPRDMFVKPKPRTRPLVEPGTATKPFKPPGVKAAIAETEPQNLNDGDSNADLGPWSKEAFDLMDWRPPNRDANGMKLTGAV